MLRRNLDIELRGIRQCLNLKHPHLLDIYDIRQDDQGDTWVVMEYVASPSLETVLDRRPNGLPPDEAIDWIRGIAAGVGHLHQQGIVHRDLKPGNVFCDEGVVKVGDYGLSKFISASRRSGHTESIGTVHYMAPEVANGRYGKEIDVYALGVILYELLTGRVPFEGESVGEVLMKHLTAKPDVSMLSEPYRSVVARALEKDPALRFPTAEEMISALPAPNDPPANSRRPTAGGMPSGAAGGMPVEIIGAAADADPVLRAVGSGWKKARTFLDKTPLSTIAKILFPLIVVILLFNAPVILPIVLLLAFWTAIAYGFYRLAMCLAAILQRRRSETPTTPTIVEPPRKRLVDLVGSLLGSAMAAAMMSVVAVLIESYYAGAADAPRPEQFAWLLLVSVAGVWAVLIPAKFWEGVRGDPLLRRFTLLVVGLGVGAAAFGLAEWLMVSLPPAAGAPQSPHIRLPGSFYAIDGRPLLMAHAACFGTLFLLMRWWRQADPLRRTRLSLWTVLMSVVVAFFVAMIWQFPQPWLPMVAGTMSVSLQLAGPWARAGRRRHGTT